MSLLKLFNELIGIKTNTETDLRTTIKYDLDEHTTPDLIGLTIGSIKKHYGSHLRLPENNLNLIAKVDNEQVNDDYEIQKGDKVEFIKVSGRKGLGVFF